MSFTATQDFRPILTICRVYKEFFQAASCQSLSSRAIGERSSKAAKRVSRSKLLSDHLTAVTASNGR